MGTKTYQAQVKMGEREATIYFYREVGTFWKIGGEDPEGNYLYELSGFAENLDELVFRLSEFTKIDLAWSVEGQDTTVSFFEAVVDAINSPSWADEIEAKS